MHKNKLEQCTVAVVGLGYVGLPLALAFGKKFRTIGFDISEAKIKSYVEGLDPTGEMPQESFKEATQMSFTADPSQLKQADFLVVAVPTPVDDARIPDLTPVIKATETVAKHLKDGSIVVYESTVYPGVTEEICVSLIEKISGKICGVHFKVGYSPERINPGDKEHTLEKIVKVVSGQDEETLEKVAWLYSSIITAGVYKASSIKVAEAAKVIENTQRDLNIALMNELAIVFHLMNIDTIDVIKTASTKWNFLPFKPGLVGGHCIGVDPYYLTYKAQLLGYNPEVILAGRRINDNMGKFIAEQTVKVMLKTDCQIKNSRVLIMGLTFKENCSDLRNSKVIDIYRELKTYGVKPVVWDPMVSKDDALHEYGIEIVDFESIGKVNAIVSAVAHTKILETPIAKFREFCSQRTPFIDVKSSYSRELLNENGFEVWRL